MRRWFLSYHSLDQALAEQLKAAIEHKDSTSRVFFAPAHLRAGGSWSAQLAQEIADATAFILLVGEKGLGAWQVFEYDEALDKRVTSPDFPLIVVLLQGQTAPGLPFLRRLHWIITPDPASEKDIARLFDATAGGGSSPGDLWRYTSPYRGLASMEEKDSDYFFGRKRETIDVLSALADTLDRVPVLIGNSGVGKSSLAQAGVLAALKRQAWPEGGGAPNGWPRTFADSRRWCFLTLRPGTEPVRALVETFLDTWRLDHTSTEWPIRRTEWADALLGRKLKLRDLLDQTRRRYVELQRSEPPVFFLYIDQGEELYVRAVERERRCFSELLAGGLGDQKLRVMMSMRADFFGELHKDETLDDVSLKIEVKPLREAQLIEVVRRPAELLSARFENDHLADDISRRAAEESAEDAGALPLLSYLLEDMWQNMVKRGDGELRLLAQSIDLGLVLVQRADAFRARNPKSEDTLRRLFTFKLATVREDGDPTRRRAFRSEFSDEEWRLVSELANHPNRLLVTATPPPEEVGETYAEVAHEAIFRRWDKLREWIAAQREFLAWRSGLEVARRGWQALAGSAKKDALLMGYSLSQAANWLAGRAEDIPREDREFIVSSIEAAQQRKFRLGAFVGGIALGEAVLLVVGFVAWINQSYIGEQWRWYEFVRPFVQAKVLPYVLTREAERSLIAPEQFRECATEQGNDYCPQMIVVPAGSFTMGSPDTEQGRYADEGPQHTVTFMDPFAVSKFVVTFDEWNTCVAYGDCIRGVDDSGWGAGQQPVINVTFDDAQRYVAWLSRMTGKPYRLLTEAEYEYATRAGSTTAYFFGNDAAMLGEYAWYTANSGRQTHPVGSRKPNDFGLYDMIGNVYSMVQDCHYANYEDAPADGSAFGGGNCSTRVLRGGSWEASPEDLRSAFRLATYNGGRSSGIGFRVARALLAH